MTLELHGQGLDAEDDSIAPAERVKPATPPPFRPLQYRISATGNRPGADEHQQYKSKYN